MLDIINYYKKLQQELVPPDILLSRQSSEELMSTDRGFITIDYLVRIDSSISRCGSKTPNTLLRYAAAEA